MIWFYITAGIIIGIIIFLFSYAKIHIEINVASIHSQLRIDVVYVFWYKKSHQEYSVDLNIILSLIESFPRESSNDHKEESGSGIISGFLDKFINTKDNLISIYDFLKKTKVDEFTWESTIGLQDADKTGLLSGSLWALKGIVISLLSSIARLKSYQINVTPNFQYYEIKSQFRCILRIRIVHIIRISIERWLLKFRGYYHGIRSSGKENGSSHRRFDENCYG